MKFKCIAVLILSLLIMGCDNEPKFDGSSPEALQYSGEKIVESLPDEKQQQLREAINLILDYYNMQALMNEDETYSRQNMRMIILNGKTVDQVISESAKYKDKIEKLESDYLNRK